MARMGKARGLVSKGPHVPSGTPQPHWPGSVLVTSRGQVSRPSKELGDHMGLLPAYTIIAPTLVIFNASVVYPVVPLDHTTMFSALHKTRSLSLCICK